MSGTITVSSTTDSQEAVEQAAEYGEQTLPFPEEEKPGTSDVEETETAAAPEPAEVPENEEEEEEEPEPQEEEPETRPRGKRDRERGLVAQVQRQASQISELEAQIRKLTASPPSPAEAPKRPDSSDRKYKGKRMEDVMEDVVDYKLQQKEAEKTAAQKAEQERALQEWATTVRERYRQQVTAAQEKYPDFNEKVDPLKVGLLTEEAIKRMTNGAEVAYHLAQHPDVLSQLEEWDKSQEAEDANRIVQTLQNLSDELKGNSSASPSSPRAPQPRPAAPRPLRHVGGTSAVTASPANPDRMSMREYNDWRNAGGGR